MYITYSPDTQEYSMYEDDVDLIQIEYRQFADGKRSQGLIVYDLYYNELNTFSILKEIRKRSLSEGQGVLDELVKRGDGVKTQITSFVFLVEDKSIVGYNCITNLTQARMHARTLQAESVKIYAYPNTINYDSNGEQTSIIVLDPDHDILGADFDAICVEEI